MASLWNNDYTYFSIATYDFVALSHPSSCLHAVKNWMYWAKDMDFESGMCSSVCFVILSLHNVEALALPLRCCEFSERFWASNVQGVGYPTSSMGFVHTVAHNHRVLRGDYSRGSCWHPWSQKFWKLKYSPFRRSCISLSSHILVDLDTCVPFLPQFYCFVVCLCIHRWIFEFLFIPTE